MQIGSESSLMYRRPWIVPHAIEYFKSLLLPNMVVLEFGSGGSTLWFADHVQTVESFEHNVEWYKRVSGAMTKSDAKKIMLRRIPNYCKHGEIEFKYPVYDVIFIDGIFRRRCFDASIERLIHGGVLAIDNANRAEIKPIRDRLRWPHATFRDTGWTTTFWFKPRP